MPGVIEKLQAASKPGVIARLQAASDPTAGQMLQQTGSSFVEGAFGAMRTAVSAGQRIQESLPAWMGGTSIGMDQPGTSTAPIVEGVPGQEERFYSRVAGVAGQSAMLAPAAAAGLPGVAIAGAAMGAEQGLQEAQAAGADVPETVLGALGQAFIGAASAYGPAGAVAKFGIPEASRGLLLEALQGAAVGAGQSLGSDVVAKATYDPERAVDVGRAVNAALEMGIVSGGTHGTLKMLEAAARLRAPKAFGAQDATEMSQSIHEATAPVQDLTGSQPRPEEPVLEKAPVAPQTEPVLTRDSAPPPAPPATATPEAGAGGVSFFNDHIDTIGRGENKMELVARDPAGKPIGVAEYTQVGDQVSIDMVTVREDMRRRGIAKRLIEEVRKANPQATINLGIAVSEAGEALRKSAETSLSNTNQANETLAPAREQAPPSVEAPPPASVSERDALGIRDFYRKMDEQSLSAVAERIRKKEEAGSATDEDKIRRAEARAEIALRVIDAEKARAEQAREEGRRTGKLTITEGEMAQLLSKGGDAYADVGYRGEYNPDVMLVSPYSGNRIRHYVTLPTGERVHPDELIEAQSRGRVVVVPGPPMRSIGTYVDAVETLKRLRGSKPAAQPPAPETPTAAPVEALTTGERAAPPPPIEAAIKAASDVPEGELTSIRHEATETDRALMGVDPYEGRPAKADVDIHARALAKLEADPHAGSKLVDELISSGRLPTDEEGMLLGMELNRLKTEYNLSKSDAAAAAYKRAADLTDSLGSEAGAAFRARRFQIAKDNSFAGLSRSLEKSKGEALTPEDKAFAENISKRLDAAEKAQAELEQKYAELEAEKAVARVKAEAAKPERATKRAARVKVLDVEIDDLVRKMASKAARANIDPEMAVDAVKLASKLIEKGVIKLADFTDFAIKNVGEHVRPYLAKAWEDAQRMRREELAKGIGEEGYTKRDLEEISKSLIESGIIEREALIDELHKIVGGDRNKVRDTLSGYGKYREASKEEVDVKLRQLKQEMQKVAQIEALERKAAPLKSGFDRGEPSDEYRRLTKKANELRKELGITTVDPERQLKTVLDANKRRLENQIRDLEHEIETKTRIVREKKQAPTSPEIEELKRQRDILKSQHDAIFNPPKEPKPDPTREQRLQGQVDRLVRRLATMDTAKKGKEQGPPTEAEARLRSKLDELRGMLRDVQKPKPPTQADIEARQIDAAIKATEKSIADYERRIAEGDLARKQGKPGPTSPQLEALRARRDALSAELDEMRAAAKPIKPKVDVTEEARLQRRVSNLVRRLATLDTEKKGAVQGPPTEAVLKLREELKTLQKRLADVQKPAPLTPEELAARAAEIATKSYMTRKANETAKLKERIARGDFEPKAKKPERVLTDAELAARAEYDKTLLEFRRKQFEYERARRTKIQKVRDAAKETLDLPKSIFSSFDVSAVGRQGAVLSGSDALLRPAQLTSRIGRMFRALANEDYALKVDAEIRAHPLYEKALKAGVEFTGHNDVLTPREEVFKSHLAEKIPGIGKAVQASERAYSTYLNLLRFDHFRRIMQASDGSASEAKAIANFINVSTGRGNVGKGKFAAVVNASGTFLWAPRLMVSRFQLLFGQPLYHGTARSRALIAREYATSLAALASVYGLVSIYQTMNPDEDVTVSSDSMSPDFGKIKLGDTRIDPLAGLSQTARLVSRVGDAVLKGSDSKFNAAEEITTFLRTKFSPTITVPYELITERNFAYGRKSPRPQTVGEVAQRMAPLSFQDTYQAMVDQGVPKGIALGILSAFGFGLQTYTKK